MRTTLHLLGDTVHGSLYIPKNAAHVVIVCHGYKSSQRQRALATIAKNLYEQGFAVFTFDFPKVKNSADLEHQVTIIKQLTSHFAPDYTHISLLAASFGALAAAIAAAELPDLTSLITINGFFGSRHIGRKYFLTYLVFRALSSVSRPHRRIQHYYASHFLPARIRAATLVIHSTVDRVVSDTQSRRFFQQLTAQKQFQTLETASHSLAASRDVALVATHAGSWLERHG